MQEPISGHRILLAAMLIASPSVNAELPFDADSAGLYFASSAADYAPATRLATEFDIEIVGIVARVSVKQRFRNSGTDWVEGVYVFPLPDDSAVDELTMWIGDRRIEGEIQEREQARRTYAQARAAGQQASLVEQERPNLFTTSVANIAPGQEVVIEIGYLQTARYEDGAFELRVPMTLTPRYVGGAVPDAARITPPVRTSTAPDTHRAAIEISIDAGMPLADAASPSHGLSATWDGQRYRLSSGDSAVPMDRDLVVSWRVTPDQTPRVAAFTETVGRETYVLLMFLPPTTSVLPETTPRELVFVIDTSGSMGGNSMARARTALQSALDRLTAPDRFNVIEFNNRARSLFATPVAVGAETLSQARRFVSGLRANGGTNIAAAVEAAIVQAGPPDFLRQIVFITDGSVGNEPEIFRMIRQGLGSARLFTVGIGTAPNTHFMRKSAQFGRGSYLQVTRAEEVEPGMQRLFARLEHVALTDIEIEWPDAIEVYPERVPDLYLGEPVVVAARMRGAPTRALSITASGRVGSYPWTERIQVAPGAAKGIASMWARRKIESLLDQRLEGASPDAIRAAVLDVALAHGMLSPYTSLVAVDRTPELTRNARLRREALDNLLPAGSNLGARFATLPGTATDAPWYQLLGTVLAALVVGLIGIVRLARKLRP